MCTTIIVISETLYRLDVWLRKQAIQAERTVAADGAVVCKSSEHVKYSDAAGQLVQTDDLLLQLNHELRQHSAVHTSAHHQHITKHTRIIIMAS